MEIRLIKVRMLIMDEHVRVMGIRERAYERERGREEREGEKGERADYKGNIFKKGTH